MTFRLPHDIFVTAAGSIVYGGGQAILQRRLLHSKYVGVSFGGAYRLEQHVFSTENVEGGPPFSVQILPDIDDTYVTHVVGGRFQVVLTHRSSYSRFLKGVFFVGYDASLSTSVVRFGIASGQF